MSLTYVQAAHAFARAHQGWRVDPGEPIPFMWINPLMPFALSAVNHNSSRKTYKIIGLLTIGGSLLLLAKLFGSNEGDMSPLDYLGWAAVIATLSLLGYFYDGRSSRWREMAEALAKPSTELMRPEEQNE